MPTIVYYLVIFVLPIIFIGSFSAKKKKREEAFRYKKYKYELKAQGKYAEWKKDNQLFLFMWNISQIGLILPFILLTLAMIKDDYTSLGTWTFYLFLVSMIFATISRKYLYKTIPADWI